MSLRPTLRLLVPALLVVAAIGGEDAQPLPNLAPTVGDYLEHDYYDQSRFQPRLMVERALRALESAEVGIETQWVADEVLLTVAADQQRVPAPEPKSLAEAMQLIERLRGAIDRATTLPAKRRRDLAYVLVNGALGVLDPHTVLMPPEPAKEFREDIAGEFYGIGAFLQQDEGVIAIERVMPGLPADKAGVEDGDVILGIDGEKTAGLSLEQAVRRIKGPKGTTVTLTVERKSAGGAIDIPITRDLVQVITMRPYRSGDVGYVRMDEFNGYTARDLFRTIQELQKNGPLKAFVLDLRFNGGGLLDQSRLVSDFFLPKGEEIVRTVTSDGQPQIYKSSSRQVLDAPMVVITSGGSASAAEILSGCLQRNDRAVVVGTTTFGKGSVQTVKDLGDGSRLKLTIQEYQLPGGVSIQDLGVTPDIRFVQHATRKDGAIDLVPFTGSREQDDEFALKNKAGYQHQSAFELGWLAKYLAPEDQKRSGIASKEFVPDQEASLVIGLVAQAVLTQDFPAGAADAAKNRQLRQFLLERLKGPIKAHADLEAAKLNEAFAKRTPAITWGSGPDGEVKPGTLALTYTGPATIAAGETVALTFRLANAGAAPIGRLYGIVRADKFSPFWEDEVVFGEVPAGGATTGTLTFKAPPRLHAGEERFELVVRRDHHDEELAIVPVSVRIKPQPRPVLDYSWKIEEQDGNGQLNPDENATLVLTLRNDGDGPSSRIDLRVFKDNDPYVQLGDKGSKIEPLPKGGTHAVRIPLTVLKEVKRGDKTVPFSADAIKLQVRAEERFDEQDGRFRATLFHALSIPVNAPLNPRPVVQPRLSLVSAENQAGGKAVVTIKVQDQNLRFLTVFHDEDKIALVPAARMPADGVYSTTLTLKPGANNLRVLAIDEDEVDEVLPVRLWGEGSPVVAKPVVVPNPRQEKPAEKAPIIP